MDHLNPDSSLGNVIVNRRERALDAHESHELKILVPPSIINDEPHKDVETDIEQKVEVEVMPVINRADRSDRVKEFTICNCTSSSSISKFFESSDIADELKDLESILSLKFHFNSSIDDINVTELSKFSQNCRSEAIVIQLLSKNDEKFSTFWKSKDIMQFLKLKPISNMNLDQRKNFNEFAADSLIEALKNGHSGLVSTYVHKPDSSEVEVNFIADIRDFNLLLQGCDKGNVKVVRTGLALGMNTTVHGSKVTAQSLALQNGHYDIILALAEANLTYPRSLDIKKCPEEFKTTYKITEMLHEHIKSNHVDKVKDILDANPQKRYFYNLRNESAIKVAIQNESMETYELLLSHKLRFGPHEDSEELLQNLSYENKRIAREIHNRHAQDSPMKHVNILLANSYICHDVDDSEEKMKYVNRAYRALNANLFIRMLLMIVAASKKFKIIFDFNRDSVSAADPTVDANTQGLFYLSGRIYVGAKQLLHEVTEYETLATMAHELCHYVMNLVYKNDAKPYLANDNLTMQEFETVSEKCKGLLGTEDVVDLVYECYSEDMHHAELIVRVVHLLALYRNNPEKLKEVSETYSDLFKFYEKTIHPQLEQALPEIEAKAEKESDEKDDLIFKYKFLLIFGGILCAILFVAGFFVVRSVFYKPTYEFYKLSDDDMLRVRNAPINYKNIDLKFIDLFPQNSKAYDSLLSDHIQNTFDGTPLNLSALHLGYLNVFINHTWGNLTGKLMNKVLNSNFEFQNESLKLGSLNEEIPKVFDSLTSGQIVNVLDGNELKVGKMISNLTKFYIERTFVDEDYFAINYRYWNDRSKVNRSDFMEYLSEFISDENYDEKISSIRNNSYFKTDIQYYKKDIYEKTKLHVNFSLILDQAMDKKFFILSAEAGTGKTITFEQMTMRMKKIFPSKWVSYIDLKDFTRSYNSSGILQNFKKLMENILRLGPGNEFERHIFWELFKSGNVVLFWNGFDEISPDYNKFIVKVLSNILKNSKNIQFVCTRPLYAEQLRDELNVHSYTLVPFTESEQSEFLKKFFISENVSKDKVTGHIEKVNNITSSLRESSDESYDNDADGDFRQFDSPLMLVMLATIISKDAQIFESENIYQIYEKFVQIKIDQWQETELGLRYVKSAFGKKFTMLDVFLKYSLKSNYQNIINLLKLKLMRAKVPKELTNDEISRTGILYVNGPANFQFAHRTFEEFFFTKFFLNNFYSDEDDLSDDDAELIYEIFYFLMLRHESYPVIFKLISAYLDTHETAKIINPKIAEIFEARRNQMLLNFRIFSNDGSVQILLKIFKESREILIILLNFNENETFYTAMFNNIFSVRDANPENTLLRVKNFAKILLKGDEYEMFINGKNQKGLILFDQFFRYSETNKQLIHDTYNLNSTIMESENLTLFFSNIVENLTELEIHELLLSNTSPIYIYTMDLLRNNDCENYEIIEEFLVDREMYKSFLLNMYNIAMNNDKYKLPYIELPEKAVETIKSEIFDLFSSKALLNYAARSATFKQYWIFLKNHTNKAQQKQLLTQEKNFKTPYVEFPQLNVFQLTMIMSKEEDNFTLNLYEEFFSNAELQGIILKSNEFLYYMYHPRLREYVNEKIDEKLNYLRKIFIGNETSLYEFLTKEIKSIKMSLVDCLREYETVDSELKKLTKFLIELKSYSPI